MVVFTEEIHYHFSSCKFLSRTFGFWAMHEKVLVSSVYFHVKRDEWGRVYFKTILISLQRRALNKYKGNFKDFKVKVFGIFLHFIIVYD